MTKTPANLKHPLTPNFYFIQKLTLSRFLFSIASSTHNIYHQPNQNINKQQDAVSMAKMLSEESQGRFITKHFRLVIDSEKKKNPWIISSFTNII